MSEQGSDAAESGRGSGATESGRNAAHAAASSLSRRGAPLDSDTGRPARPQGHAAERRQSTVENGQTVEEEQAAEDGHAAGDGHAAERAADEREPTAVGAWIRLLRGHAGMRRAVTAQLQADHGLTVNEYEALLLLSHAEDNHMRRVDLADSLQLTPSGVTRLLDGLRERGYVERATCSSDARVAYAVLLDAGRTKIKEASCSHVAAIRALFEERYSAAEIETLAELLGRLPGGGGDAASCTA